MTEDLIKPEDIADGEIDAVIEMAEEIEIERVDYSALAYNMSLVYSNLPDIDMKMLSVSEQGRIDKMKTQTLKLLCFAIDELHKEHFPKKEKK